MTKSDACSTSVVSIEDSLKTNEKYLEWKFNQFVMLHQHKPSGEALTRISELLTQETTDET